MPGCNLKHCPNGIANQTDRNRLLPTQPVAESKRENSTEEGTELNFNINLIDPGRFEKTSSSHRKAT